MAHKEMYLSWLKDAYAMEKNLIQVLENRVKDTKDFPDMQSKVQEHLSATHRHADLVKGCIERNGDNVSSIKTGLASVMGALQGISTGFAKDEIVKNCLSDCAAEHFEIACYKGLIAAGQYCGDYETVRVCEQILRDEEDMASWLEQKIPVVINHMLGKEAAEHREERAA